MVYLINASRNVVHEARLASVRFSPMHALTSGRRVCPSTFRKTVGPTHESRHCWIVSRQEFNRLLRFSLIDVATYIYVGPTVFRSIDGQTVRPDVRFCSGGFGVSGFGFASQSEGETVTGRRVLR